MKYLEWVEPVPGMNEDGSLCSCTQIIRMSIPDVIKHTRRVHHELALRAGSIPPKDEGDYSLIDDFKAVHWASEVEV